MKKIEKTIKFADKDLTLTYGEVAQQATSSVMAKYGDTVVLATVVDAPMKIDLGYFPLTVDYQERLYAGGRIKGSRWVKREGRPLDDEILTGRLIDRSIRPLFPHDYKGREVQVMVTLLSVDMENSPDVVSSIAVSAALTASPIPWSGPVATLRIGKVGEKFIVNPLTSEMPQSDLDLIVSSTEKAVVMIEAGANQVDEATMLDAIKLAHTEGKTLNKFIQEFAKETGVEKLSVKKDAEEIELKKQIKDVKDIIGQLGKNEMGHTGYYEYKKALASGFDSSKQERVMSLIDDVVKEEIKKMILLGKRPDGRKMDEIRKLTSRVEILPRVHGSALFQRGQTQVLTVTTLGAPSLGQLIESAEGEEEKRYIHHYSMPPYSTGETGRVGSPSRREIGHGALAERALIPVIPTEDEFPYTIRVVSEVLSSNGSTSMASTCASTLSLMDAGVPIKAPVAGIAMGLVVEDEKDFKVLTDITGLEDNNGDMDFKVAGTEKGITALQLDVKTLNLTLPILTQALKEAKKARETLMKVILETMPVSRPKVSTHAPKIKVVKIPQEKIGEVIGPGGRMIKSIIAETKAQLDIEDDGSVTVSGMTDEEVGAAIEKVELLTKEVKADELYQGIVKRIEPFGAFIEILPGRDGMVHVSDMSEEFVKDPHDIVKIGDEVQVRVKEIDNLGRINLSMILDKSKEKKNTRDFAQEGRSRNFSRGGGGRSDRPRGQRSSGPHFPTSRYVESDRKRF